MSEQPTDPQQPPSPHDAGSPPPPPPQGYPQQGYGAHPGQPQPGGYPQPGYGPAHPQAPARPSVVGGLADLGFVRRITPELARVVYVAVIVLAALLAVEGVVHAIRSFIAAGSMFGGGGVMIWDGLRALVRGPLFGFLLLALGRFGLEYFLDRAAASRRA